MDQKRLPATDVPWPWVLTAVCVVLTVMGLWLHFAPQPPAVSGPMVVPFLFVAPPLVFFGGGKRKRK